MRKFPEKCGARMPREGYGKMHGGVERQFTGLYSDMVRHPLASVETREDLRRFSPPPLPPQEYYQGVRRELQDIRRRGHAAIVNLIASCFEFAWYLRGFARFMEDLVLNPPLACGIMDMFLEFQIAQFDALLSRVGEWVDVVLCGDDLATQRGPILSLELYRKYVKPRQKKLYEAIKKKTRAFLFYHSCGAITPFLSDLVDIGVEIINPVQVSAEGMDTRRLKKEFGAVLSFWGGIDTQRVLPFGSEKEVREEVRRRIDDLAPGGGYVLCAVHNLQADVPAENIVAMYEEALSYGRSKGGESEQILSFL